MLRIFFKHSEKSGRPLFDFFKFARPYITYLEKHTHF